MDSAVSNILDAMVTIAVLVGLVFGFGWLGEQMMHRYRRRR